MNNNYVLFNTDRAVEALSEVVVSLIGEGVSIVEGEVVTVDDILDTLVDDILDTLEAFGVTFVSTRVY